MLFETDTTPVELLTVIVAGAVEGATLCTTIELMLPLSVGLVAGLMVNEFPEATDWFAKLSTGGVLAVTLTVRLTAFDKPVVSFVVVSVTVLSPSAAVQLATTSAVMMPPLLIILVMLRPVGTAVAVTVNTPADVSLTVAICELIAALPCCRVSEPLDEMVGGPLVALQGENSDVLILASVAVAVAVMNCPAGSAGTMTLKLTSPLSLVKDVVVDPK